MLLTREPRKSLIWGQDLVYRWHLSISRQDRYPSWEEIKDARYALMPPNIVVAQILPPKNDYVNIHPNCFHLWEVPDGLTD